MAYLSGGSYLPSSSFKKKLDPLSHNFLDPCMQYFLALIWNLHDEFTCFQKENTDPKSGHSVHILRLIILFMKTCFCKMN